MWLGATANEVVDKLVSQLENNTLTADLTLRMEESATQVLTYSGKIVMRGNKFRLEMTQMEIAYDGSTLYTYQSENNELTLSTPTAEELSEIIPQLYMKQLLQQSTPRVEQIGDRYKIIVDDFTLIISRDYLPLTLTMKESATKKAVLKLQNAVYSQAQPAFSISKAGAYLNDLR